MRNLFWAISLATLMSGCSATNILSKISGASRFLAEENVPYGGHPEQRMDIYRPSSSSKDSRQPVCKIVFVYGGSWQSGDKEGYGFVAARLAEAGYVVAIPNYRKHPEVVFPSFVSDLALALAHSLLSRRSENDRLVLMGHSAGALNAALVAFDKQYLTAAGLDPGIIDLLISIAGPHDFFLPSEKQKWKDIFGDTSTDQVRALSVNHVTGQAPPTLILHGENDSIVTPRSAHSLAAKLAANDVQHTIKTYPTIGHRRIVAAMATPLGFLAPTAGDVIDFLQENECKPTLDPSE